MVCGGWGDLARYGLPRIYHGKLFFPVRRDSYFLESQVNHEENVIPLWTCKCVMGDVNVDLYAKVIIWEKNFPRIRQSENLKKSVPRNKELEH
jgi:hypothetical protein